MKAFLEYIPLLFFLVFYKLDPRPLSLGGFDFSVGGIYSATAVLMLSTVVLYGALWFKEGKLTRMQWLVVGAVLVITLAFAWLWRANADEAPSGLRGREREIILRDAANQVVSVPAKSVARRTSVGSLMPAGLLDSLLPEERLDLFRFLAQLGKPGEFDAARGGVARLWKLYLIVSGNQHLGSERVVAGDFTLPGWATVLSLTGGALPGSEVERSFGQRGNSRGLFAATQFESARGGTVTGRLWSSR